MSEWEYMMGQRVAELEQELEAAEAKADIAQGRIYDLNARLVELNYDTTPELQRSLQAAEAKLEAVRVLADSWVGTWAETCADELEATLNASI